VLNEPKTGVVAVPKAGANEPNEGAPKDDDAPKDDVVAPKDGVVAPKDGVVAPKDGAAARVVVVPNEGVAPKVETAGNEPKKVVYELKAVELGRPKVMVEVAGGSEEETAGANFAVAGGSDVATGGGRLLLNALAGMSQPLIDVSTEGTTVGLRV